MEKKVALDNLCIEYAGKKFFVGEMARWQSTVRATLNSDRFTSIEGMALMLTALALLSDSTDEQINLVTGLAVSDFQKLKKEYRQALLGRHNIKPLQPDGKWGVDYSVTIKDVKVIPQPIGTLFWSFLAQDGQVRNWENAASRIGILDI